MSGMPKIDEPSYLRGRKAFRKNGNFRVLIEADQAAREDADRSQDPEAHRRGESESFSAFVGFIDELVDAIRRSR